MITKKYFILTLTFLCLLCSHLGYGMVDNEGDDENFCFECNNELGEVVIPGTPDSGDPCDSWSSAYDYLICHSITDSGDFCDPFSSSYNLSQCMGMEDSGDPCDIYSYAYDPSICIGVGDEGDVRGGDTGDTIGTPYVPSPTDKLAKPNIDFNVEKQSFKTCAIASLYNALVKILGENVELKELNAKAAIISNSIYFIENGLNGSDAIKLINEYTTTRDITFSGPTAFKDAIDAGHCIIGIFPSGNIAHQVTIIGYQQNGDIIYMDSNTGRTDTRPETTFIRSEPGSLLEIINAK